MLVWVAVPAAGGVENGGAGEAVEGAAAGLFLLLFLAALLFNALFVMAQTAASSIGEVTGERILARERSVDRLLIPFLGRLPLLEQKFAAAALLMLIVMALSLAEAGMAILPGMRAMGAFLGAFAALLLHLVISEVIARGRALANPLGVFRLLFAPCFLLALPFTLFLIPGRLFGGIRGGAHPTTTLSDMHLRLLPSLSGVERVIRGDALEMIDSVREFAESTAEDIMTPRTEVDGIADTMPPGEVYDRLRKSEYSRLVVYHENMDNIRGTLLAKEVLLRRPKDPLSLLRDPIFIDEKARLPELLKTIRDNRTHLLVAIDEYGGMAGIVTLHDLFEAIVGHIEDLEDEPEFWMERLDGGEFRVSGRVEIWELNEEFDLSLDEELARTAGGLVFNTLGRVAQEGDEIEMDGLRFIVEETRDNRIETLRISRVPPEAGPAALPETEKGR